MPVTKSFLHLFVPLITCIEYLNILKCHILHYCTQQFSFRDSGTGLLMAQWAWTWFWCFFVRFLQVWCCFIIFHGTHINFLTLYLFVCVQCLLSCTPEQKLTKYQKGPRGASKFKNTQTTPKSLVLVCKYTTILHISALLLKKNVRAPPKFFTTKIWALQGALYQCYSVQIIFLHYHTLFSCSCNPWILKILHLW